MINIPAVPKPENPAFFDLIITQVQDVLKAKLSWLDYSFGRSQSLVREREGRDYRYPAVHIRDNDYQSVAPNNELGNFSFFTIFDPQEIDFQPHTTNNVTAKYALTFWLNLDSIFESSTERNTEELKTNILRILTRELFLTFGRLSVTGIQEEARNIYREYSLKEIDSQYLMQPYAGFRFEGNMLFNEVCVAAAAVTYLKDPQQGTITNPQGGGIIMPN